MLSSEINIDWRMSDGSTFLEPSIYGFNKRCFCPASEDQFSQGLWSERQVSPRLPVNQDATFLFISPTWMLGEKHIADSLMKANYPIQDRQIGSYRTRRACERTAIS